MQKIFIYQVSSLYHCNPLDYLSTAQEADIQGVPKVSSHFVLVVFSPSRARTEFHFTIFQQPRRRFQNSPYFPPYVKIDPVTEQNVRQP